MRQYLYNTITDNDAAYYMIVLAWFHWFPLVSYPTPNLYKIQILPAKIAHRDSEVTLITTNKVNLTTTALKIIFKSQEL